jgi:hypothetical protein
LDPVAQCGEGPILARKIDSIEAADDYTAAVRTKGVQVDIAYNFAPDQVTSGRVFSKSISPRTVGRTSRRRTS